MNKKKIVCYWSPFISTVATVKAVLNSALSINLYSKNTYDSLILNVFGEWDTHLNDRKYKLNFYNLNNIKRLFYFSSEGYIKSRIKYLMIFILSFNSLKRFLLKKKPEFLIVHLVTSLPLFLNLIYNFDTKIILRISGKPQINIFRYIFWKIALRKVYKVTFPTLESLEYFQTLKIIDNRKLFLLHDPVFIYKDLVQKKEEPIDNDLNFKKNDYFLSIGRLTKQKNFIFLLKCFSKIIKDHKDIKLAIIGVGEEKNQINNYIKTNKLESNIILLGYQNNVYNFLKNSKAFILPSLWEDPGFVLIEAMATNCLVLSSDCPNGPKEIIENKNGLLFKSNSEKDFILKFNQMLKLSDNEKKEIQINAKKKIKSFSIFNHFKQLQNILAKY
tara:strand:- start:4379 stop:5539 length:1161 start_codon:yes stop_codon:yes gene_type:complete